MNKSMLGMYVLLLLLLGSSPAWAENEGLPELDQALAAKLAANDLDDLGQVIKQAEAALEKGLDEENTTFAKQLLAAAHFERASVVSQAIFGPGGPDPRWPQLRQLAVPELEKSVGYYPEQPQAHYLLARLHTLPGGNRDRAMKALDAVIAAPDVETDILAKSYTLRAGLQTDEEKRLADFSKAIELAPNEAEAVRARGLIYLLQEKVSEAIADLQKASELEPDHSPTLEALGLALMMDKKYDEALKHLEKAIELNPDAATPYANRARVYIIQNELDKALADLDLAVEKNPAALPVVLLRARVHAQMGKLPEALADVDRATRARPGWLPALRLRAELLAGSGKIGEAIKGLEQLTETLPTNSELQLQLGTYYLANKQPRKAIEIFTAILESEPTNLVALRGRADARLGIGQQAAAIADYEAALKVDPQQPSVLNNLAWVLATSPDDSLRNGKRAVELATKAAELTEHERPYILSTLAAAYAETGDFETARKWSQKALDLDDGEQEEHLTAELQSFKENKPWRELQNVEEEVAAQDPAEPKAEATPPARTIDF